MKIIHQDGFGEEERRNFKGIIYANILGSMKTLVNAADDLNLAIGPGREAQAVRETKLTATLTKELFEDIKVQT